MSPRPVVLVLPPQWVPQNPPFALAALGGHLRSRGVPTRLVDLNLEWFLELLTPESLDYHRHLALLRRDHLLRRCQLRITVGDEGPDTQRDAAHVMAIDGALETRPDPWTEVSRGLGDAVATMRDPERFYHPERLVEALQTIDEALRLTSLPYFPSHLALNDYRNPRVDLTLDSLEKATRDTWTNMFLRFLRRAAAHLDGDLVAVSINAYSQVLPGLTLARLLKESGRCHVALGGNFFGRLAHRLREMPRFFELFCDTLMIGEGEDALERLTRGVLDGSGRILSPNTLYLRHGVVESTPPDPRRLPLEEVGFLDFGDLPLDRYLSPEPVACIQASRGCYWGRCSFCDSYWGVSLDAKSTDRVVAELRHVRERFGIRHFEFTDECMRPQDMASLAKAVRKAGLDVRWFANARTEPGFACVLDDLVGGGLSMLLWGFESGSERVLRRIAKGVHFKRRMDVLRKAAEAGVWNFAYIFFGFPGETPDDALATIRAICDNTAVIHSYGRSVFSLGRHSPMAAEPELFGITSVTEEGQDLSVDIRFELREGPGPEQVRQYAELCTRLCREAYGSPLWMVLRNRENLHLYLVRYGARRVADWRLDVPDELSCFQK